MSTMIGSIWKFFIAFALVLVLGGCAHIELPIPGQSTKSSETGKVDVSGIGDGVDSQRVVIQRIPFPADEYAQLKSVGNATVKGTIAIRVNGQRIVGHQKRELKQIEKLHDVIDAGYEEMYEALYTYSTKNSLPSRISLYDLKRTKKGLQASI